MTRDPYDVVVVGGGHNGLVAAAYLARAGLSVLVLDHSATQVLGDRLFPGGGYRTPVPGLYLCGAGTHPGGEVSGAPGHNAAHAVLADLARDQG